MKKTLALLLVVTLLLTIPSYAMQARATIAPTFTISGNTARCSVNVTQANARIEVYIELWHGNTMIEGWSASGTGYVRINGTCEVEVGETYVMIVNGTVNGLSFDEYSIERTC